jgi:hypothetical protein
MLLTIRDCVSDEQNSVKILATIFPFLPHLVALYISHELLNLAVSTDPELVRSVRDESFVVTVDWPVSDAIFDRKTESQLA